MFCRQMGPPGMPGYMGEISDHNDAPPVENGYAGTSPRQSDAGYFGRRPGSGGQLNQIPNQWTSGKHIFISGVHCVIAYTQPKQEPTLKIKRRLSISSQARGRGQICCIFWKLVGFTIAPRSALLIRRHKDVPVVTLSPGLGKIEGDVTRSRTMQVALGPQ